MDISSLFPSSDNLYKFLFMGGIFMIAFSFIYPLEKKQRIELEINLYNKQAELFNNDITVLNNNINKLKKQAQESLNSLEKQKSEKNEKKANENIKAIQESYNKTFNDSKNKENEIITKNIVLKYEKEKISLLENQAGSFSIFRWVFLVCGAVFTIFGLIKWYISSSMTEKMQAIELEKRKNELANPTIIEPPQTPAP